MKLLNFFYNERKKRNLKFKLLLVTNGILLEKHEGVLNNAWIKFLFDFSKYNIFKPYNDCKSIMIYDSYCYYIQKFNVTLGNIS